MAHLIHIDGEGVKSVKMFNKCVSSLVGGKKIQDLAYAQDELL